MKITTIGVWGAYPEAEQATSSFLLEEDNFKLLIDCGSGVLSQLQKYVSLNQLDSLIISHYHNDHIADVGCLQYALMIQKKLGNRNGVFPIFGHDKDREKFSLLSYQDVTLAKPVNEQEDFIIGPFEVSLIKAIHPVYSLSIKFRANGKTIVYTGDTEWNSELVRFADQADLIISEANLYDEQINEVKGHLTAGQAGELADKAKAKKLLLTHLPHFGNHQDLLEQAKQQFNGEVFLAKPGLTLNI